MINKWIIVEPEPIAKVFSKKPQSCLLVLPGRGIPGDAMEHFARHVGLWKTLTVVLEPQHFEWYPAPNGPDDQDDAVKGQIESLIELKQYLSKIQKLWEIPNEQTAIVGFSAGAVMALQLCAHSDTSFAGVVSLAGAILNPDTFLEAPNNTPILLQHNEDDDCFKWGERYLPMKQTLHDKGYNVQVHERDWGGHNLTLREARLTQQFLASKMGYTEQEEGLFV